MAPETQKKLNIGMYFSSDPSMPGGVAEHVYNLSTSLVKRGHQVTVFGPKESTRFPHYQCIGSMIEVPMPNGNWTYITFSNSGAHTASRYINEKNFDICNIQEPYMPFLAWELLREVKVPIVPTFHLAWDDNSVAALLPLLFPIFKKPFSSYISGAIYISQIARKRWQGLCMGSVPQQMILNGLDHSRYFPTERRDGDVHLMFLARLVQKKGLSYLLQAMAMILPEHPNVHLTIVGEGQERTVFEEYAVSHNLMDNVVFMGSVSDAVKIQQLQQADIFCAPYVDEGYGIAVLEAMACGCAIVGFKNEAFKETLNGYPGEDLLVKQKDAKTLAAALKKLIKNRARMKELQQWALKESKKYDWDVTAEKTEAFYYKILSKR